MNPVSSKQDFPSRSGSRGRTRRRSTSRRLLATRRRSRRRHGVLRRFGCYRRSDRGVREPAGDRDVRDAADTHYRGPDGKADPCAVRLGRSRHVREAPRLDRRHADGSRGRSRERAPLAHPVRRVLQQPQVVRHANQRPAVPRQHDHRERTEHGVDRSPARVRARVHQFHGSVLASGYVPTDVAAEAPEPSSGAKAKRHPGREADFHSGDSNGMVGTWTAVIQA